MTSRNHHNIRIDAKIQVVDDCLLEWMPCSMVGREITHRWNDETSQEIILMIIQYMTILFLIIPYGGLHNSTVWIVSLY